MRHRNTGLLPFVALAFFGISWGATIPLLKTALNGGLMPLGVIFWQMVFSAIVLGAVMLLRGIRLKVSRLHLTYYLVIGLLGTLIPQGFSNFATEQLPGGIMGIIIATVPMCTMLIALGLGNETFQWSRMLGVLLGIVAMLFLTVPDASLPEPEKVVFVFVALVAPLCYALEGNYISMRAPQDVNPIAVLFGASVIGAFLAVPLAWFSGHWANMFVVWGEAHWALLFSSILHALAYAGYIWLVGYSGAVFSSQIGYIVTMAAVFLSMIFLGESYSVFVWIALCVMLVGLSLVQPKSKPAQIEGSIPQ